MTTIAKQIATSIEPKHLIEHCSQSSVSSMAAITCNGWAFTFKDGSELTVGRSGAIIDIN